jgi:hypothetical protein
MNITKDTLQEKIINLVDTELKNPDSEISQMVDKIIVDIVNDLINVDNDENDINWNELGSLFGIYNSIGEVITDGIDIYVNIDDTKLEAGKEYTLRYNNINNEPLDNFDIIKTFTI